MKEPVISVLVLSYNHERYIARALDSILAQETKYPFEIIIGNDCSTDGTEDLVMEYFKEYPEQIRVIKSVQNAGTGAMYHKLLQSARGKYIATLEGDDYWCSPEKLQKQAEFLEGHPEYAAVSHRVMVVDQDGTPIPAKNDYTKNTFWNYRSNIYTIKDFQDGCYAGHISSILYRNFMQDARYRQKALVALRVHRIVVDRSVSFLLAMAGSVYRLDDIMSCYRFVESGDASNYQAVTRQKNIRDEDYQSICRLEDIGKKYIGREFSLYPLLKDKLIGASIYAWDYPTSENIRVVTKMLGMRKNRVRYAGIVFLSIIKKLYYRTILKEDRTVVI